LQPTNIFAKLKQQTGFKNKYETLKTSWANKTCKV